MCSTAAHASASPSKVEVPRPISSSKMSERGVAELRMTAVSVISTIKVERPRARLSLAPMRVKMRSTAPRRALRAGTKQPICAMITISAVCRRYVSNSSSSSACAIVPYRFRRCDGLCAKSSSRHRWATAVWPARLAATPARTRNLSRGPSCSRLWETPASLTKVPSGVSSICPHAWVAFSLSTRSSPRRGWSET